MSVATYAEIQKKHRHLVARDSRAWLGFFLQTAFTALAVFLSLSSNYGVWVVGQLALGLAGYQWFVILHSCGHGSFFRTPFLNISVGHFASIFCAVPFYPWKYAHTQHHVWTGWRDYDPVTRDLFPQTHYPELLLKAVDFSWRFWVPVFWLVYCFNSFWNVFRLWRVRAPLIQKYRMGMSVVFLASVYVGLIFALGMLVLKLFVLSTVILLVMLDLITLSQHNSIPARSIREDRASGKTVTPFNPVDHDAYTRSLVFPAWVSRWIFFHFDRHAEHHALPQVPHYSLDEVEFDPRISVPGLVWLREAKKIRGRDLLLSEWGTDTNGQSKENYSS